MNDLWCSFQYVMNAPYFVQTMGLTTASSMFIGATLYNGDLKTLAKGMITLIPYVLLLLAVTIIRLTSNPITNPVLACAGLATIIFLTIFYVLGLLLGVEVVKLAHKDKSGILVK